MIQARAVKMKHSIANIQLMSLRSLHTRHPFLAGKRPAFTAR